jgi:D-alanyl-D-alanine carboxypeptidase
MPIQLFCRPRSAGRFWPLSLFLLALTAATLHAEAPASKPEIRSEAGPSASLDAAIRDYAALHNFSGTVHVRENGKDIYRRSFGIADRAFDVPVKDDTEFRIASITKAFTAVLVLQLSEEGKIDLNKTIRFYLPSYSGEAGDRATIENLLNHTSGMQNLDAEIKSYDAALKSGVEHYQMPFTTDDFIRKFCSGKLVHEPGKVFDYNNAEYIILGKIIEKVAGKPYEDVLEERVLRPLAMKNSGMLYEHEILKNLSSTYFTTDGGKTFANDMPIYIENWYAAGAMYSTTSDLQNFAGALFGGKLLKPESLDRMLKPRLDGYGYGVWIGFPDFGGKHFRAINRPGGVMGANGSLRHFNGIGFDENLDVVILSNTNATDLDGFSWMIGKTLLDKP